MKKIRVLVVDDSILMRNFLTDILTNSGMVEVVGTANDGIEAIEKARLLLPEVITLDVEMPRKNGLETLKEIMQNNPTPIIMLSFLTKEGADTTIRALQYGAFDFVAKPSRVISGEMTDIKNELIDKILLAYNQKNKWIQQWSNIGKLDDVTEDLFSNKGDKIEGIVAIGTSTGGPKALQEVLPYIPKYFPYSILIVQHMPTGFTSSLASRLDSISKIHVNEAVNGQILEQGTAYIAPGNYHMTLAKGEKGYKINLNQDEPVGSLRPSIDVLFTSLKDINLNKIFVIMTGMGSDGTKGIINAKNEETDIVIAEDERSCVVYGMPKSVVQSGMVDEVVMLNDIPNSIIKTVKKQRGWQ